MIKKILIFNLFICVNIGFSQSKNCDCIVGIEPANLFISLHELGLTGNDEIPKEYQPLLPLKKGTPAYHKIIKDTAAFWYIQPHVHELKSKYSSIKSRKLNTTFFISVQFNGQDSIPVYSESNENSKIVRYIKQIKNKPEENEHWFVGCKNNYVKILVNAQEKNGGGTLKSGWIGKEYYLHK